MGVNSEIVFIDPNMLMPHPRNARTHSDHQVKQLCMSIREFGFTSPVLVDESHGILAGHGRVLAALQLGINEIPCVVVSHLSPAQKRAYVLADNQLLLLGGWDEEKLSQEVDELRQGGFPVPILGLSASDLRKLRDLHDDEDEESETRDQCHDVDRKDVWVQPGDYFQLGEHRLLCGDATNHDDVVRLMHGDIAQLVLTDPPYNVNYEGGDGQKIQNDHMGDDQFLEFCRGFSSRYFEVLAPGGSIYMFHSDSMGHIFRRALIDAGLTFEQCLIWNKQSLIIGRMDYQMKHEPILYGRKSGGLDRWFGDQSQPTVVDFDKPKSNDIHPTMKPVGLLEYFIKNSSEQGEIVVDLFGGSGSTMIACETTGRRCRSMELDPRYLQVSVERWEKFTGLKAEKVV